MAAFIILISASGLHVADAADAEDQQLRNTAEATVAALRSRFGTAGYRYAIDDDARLIFAVALDDTEFDALRAELREQAEALHAALFEHEPRAYVSVVMPTKADYGKMVRFRNVPGLYVDSSRSLVVRERGYVLAHEFTHALHAGDRHATPDPPEHAPWINEGFGGLCESADFSGGTFTPRDNPRFAALVFAAKRKAIIPLERLITMPQRDFVRRPNLTYGQSAYLMLYLWEKNLLRKFYDEYKCTCAADPTGRAALETVTGLTLPALQEDWRLWLAARAKSSKTE